MTDDDKHRAAGITRRALLRNAGAAGAAAAVDSTKIVGDRGELTFSTFDFGPVRLSNDSGVEEYDLPVLEHVQQPLVQTIVDELRGVGACPSTGSSADRTSKIMDEIVGRSP